LARKSRKRAPAKKKFRLVTRCDFDGLVSAVLLKERDVIGDIAFVEPGEMQAGRFRISKNDITTNLPFVRGAHLAFDHHISEVKRVRPRKNYVNDPAAPSASRLVFRHFGGARAFAPFAKSMVAAVDKADAGRFTLRDVLHPKGWVLLHFLLDPRTGLGRFRNFRVSNEELMLHLTDECRRRPLARVLRDPDVVERSSLYFVLQEKFREQTRKCATVHGNVVALDLRDEDPIWPGNRFAVYALYPECNISIHVTRDRERPLTEFAVGKSIFDRSAKFNIGQIMLEFEGGGHENAGACHVPNRQAKKVLERLIETLNAAA